jgi:hypothetical protein
MQVSRKQGYIAHVTGHHFKEIVENISQKYHTGTDFPILLNEQPHDAGVRMRLSIRDEQYVSRLQSVNLIFIANERGDIFPRRLRIVPRNDIARYS